jgi:hypothetical protein
MARRAFTLVEILIAGMVMVLVIVPLVGLMTSQKSDQYSEEGMSEAVAICQDIMEKLVSSALPFEVIDPAGGSALIKGGADNQTNQAGFKTGMVRNRNWSQAEIDILGPVNSGVAAPLGPTRVKTVKGRSYLVYFFAGKYPDDAQVADLFESTGGTAYTRPDIENTLTFAYLDKPAGYGQPFTLTPNDKNTYCNQVILAGASSQVSVQGGGQPIPVNPYAMGSYIVTGGSTARAESFPRGNNYYYKEQSRTLPPDRQGYGLIPGWQDPRDSGALTGGLQANATNAFFNPNGDPPDPQRREQWAAHLKNVVTNALGAKPTVAYHPFVVDQRTLRQTSGSFMKIILGVKFNPYDNSFLRGGRGGSNLREFWLISFKANIEDR